MQQAPRDVRLHRLDQARHLLRVEREEGMASDVLLGREGGYERRLVADEAAGGGVLAGVTAGAAGVADAGRGHLAGLSERHTVELRQRGALRGERQQQRGKCKAGPGAEGSSAEKWAGAPLRRRAAR